MASRIDHAAEAENGTFIMRILFRSDFFRHFMGGFVVAAVALVALQPAQQTAELKARIHAAVERIA